MATVTGWTAAKLLTELAKKIDSTAVAEAARDAVGTALRAGAGVIIDVDDNNDTITIGLDGTSSSGPSGFVDTFSDTFVGGNSVIIQGGAGVTDHGQLTGRDNVDSHPISSITGLQSALDGKAVSSHVHGGTESVAPNRILGRVTPSVGIAEALTPETVAGLLPQISATGPGLAPAISGTPSPSRVLSETGWRAETGGATSSFKGAWAPGQSYTVGSVVDYEGTLWRLKTTEPGNGYAPVAKEVETKRVVGQHTGTYTMPVWADKRQGDKVVLMIGARTSGTVVSSQSGLTQFHTDTVTTVSPASNTQTIGYYRDVGPLGSEPSVSVTINGSSAPSGMVVLQWILLRNVASGAPAYKTKPASVSIVGTEIETTDGATLIPATAGYYMLQYGAFRGSGANPFSPTFGFIGFKLPGRMRLYTRAIETVLFGLDHLNECNFGFFTFGGVTDGTTLSSLNSNLPKITLYYTLPYPTFLSASVGTIMFAGASGPHFDKTAWELLDKNSVAPSSDSLEKYRSNSAGFQLIPRQHLYGVLSEELCPSGSDSIYSFNLEAPDDPHVPTWAAVTFKITGKPKVLNRMLSGPYTRNYPLLVDPSSAPGDVSTLVYRWMPQEDLDGGGFWYNSSESSGSVEFINYKTLYVSAQASELDTIPVIYHPDMTTDMQEGIKEALAAIPLTWRSKIANSSYAISQGRGVGYRYRIFAASGVQKTPNMYRAYPSAPFVALENPNAGETLIGSEYYNDTNTGRVLVHELCHAIDRLYSTVGTPITINGQTQNFTGYLSDHPAFLTLHSRVGNMGRDADNNPVTPTVPTWTGMNDRYRYSAVQPVAWSSIQVGSNKEFFAESLARHYIDTIWKNTDKSYINGNMPLQYTPPTDSTLLTDLQAFFTAAGLL